MSLTRVWKNWKSFSSGKKKTTDLEHFRYYLEENLRLIYLDIKNRTYKHGPYKKYVVHDSKRREISVANIRDRVVHRMVYEYLVSNFDKTFIYDLWSCRKGKGLVAGINRTQEFLNRYSRGYVWRADVRKFFDSVDHEILLTILSKRIKDETAMFLIKEIIASYPVGLPIGNLTSQVFANIYLNELDRFVKNKLKPQAYLRYGDDFIMICDSPGTLKEYREAAIEFLHNKLKLEINTKNDIVVKAKEGLYFLGVEVYPKGRRLKKRNLSRARERLNLKNVSSYSGLIKQNSNSKEIKKFQWEVLEKIGF